MRCFLRCLVVQLVIFSLPVTAAMADTATFGPLVSAEWLHDHLGDDGLVILDATVVTERLDDGTTQSVSGRAQYEEGHIPGAAFADLTTDLADPDSPYRFTVPEPAEFAATMAALGVGDDTRVVLYDAAGSMWAARVWWMLRWIGFDNAAILDGGMGAWTAAEFPVSTDAPTVGKASLGVNLRPELIADKDEVRAAIADESVALIDALPDSHFRGEWTLYSRPGHIESATNVPVFSVLDDNGRFRPAAELKELFSDHAGSRSINYCGGGIAASGTAFAMALAGYDDVAVYTNSLQEWTADPENPMVTGADDAP